MQNQAEMERVNRLALGSMRPAIEGRSVYYAVKRGVDIFAAGALLLFFLPLMMVIAAAIYIYSPGPIFFRQERVGARRVRRGGHFYWERVNFPCLKFRTMKVNVDSAIHEQYVKALIQNDQKQMEVIQGGSTPIRKLVNDPRIIRPGRLLRKLSLDELPQFWNVLVGDMSRVGPRPAIA